MSERAFRYSSYASTFVVDGLMSENTCPCAQRDGEPGRDGGRDLVLDGEDVRELTVETVGPQVIAVASR